MRIGIVAQEHEDIFGVHKDYLSLIEMFGTPVIISPIDEQEFFPTYKIDGLVLPGGSDVNPKRYGALFSFMSYRPNPFLEYFDENILPLILGAKIPVFGICRGLQTLNVHFGGTLHQHLWKHPRSSHKEDLVHEVTTMNGNKFGVNSFHHQCISNLSESFEVVAASSKDGVIEAISHKWLSIVAVQWHPERIHDRFSLEYMEKLFS